MKVSELVGELSKRVAEHKFPTEVFEGRSREDQELWESVAKQSFSDFNRKNITHNYGDLQKNARSAFNAADAFMEERAKRLKGDV